MNVFLENLAEKEDEVHSAQLGVQSSAIREDHSQASQWQEGEGEGDTGLGAEAGASWSSHHPSPSQGDPSSPDHTG